MTPARWKKLESLFESMIALPAQEREAFLAAHTGGDLDLADEVRKLAGANDRSHPLLDSPVLESSAAPGLVPGTRIGPYEVERLIGSGGMGTVYLARRADQQFEKQVAIKLIPPGLAGSMLAGRFHDERQILASLEHPNVARLLDSGFTEYGQAFLVMEFVDGQTLDHWCSNRAHSIEEHLGLWRKIAAAVGYAHRNLVIHRDLKPGNILVDTNGEPKLVDFGIAKLLENPQAQAHTVTGANLLTPLYASPEQLSGAKVTTATDIYSLGVVLYEMLTGKHPFRRPEQTSSALLQTVLHEEPRVPKDLPIDLRAILGKALDKDPLRRYATIDQFIEDIDCFREARPVTARTATALYRTRRFVARHRVVVSLAAAAVVSLAVGATVAFWQSRVARMEARRAVEINRFLREMLAAPDPGRDGRTVTVASVLDRVGRRVQTELGSDPVVQAGVEATMGGTYKGLGMYAEADRHLRTALDLYTKLEGPGSESVAAQSLELAGALRGLGDLAGAERSARVALRIFRERHDDKKIAEALSSLGSVLLEKGDLSGAELAQREALSKLEGRNELDSTIGIQVVTDLAVVLGTSGRWDEALNYHRRAVEIARRALPRDHPIVANAIASLASALADTHHPDEAGPLFAEAIAIRRAALGDDHPDLAWALYNYAFMLTDGKKDTEAMALVSEILSHRGRSLPEEHPIVAATLFLEGRILVERKKSTEALGPLGQCLELRRRTLPAGHWLLASTTSLLGQALSDSGQNQKGAALLNSSYQELLQRFGPDHPQTRLALKRLQSARSAPGFAIPHDL
jgi:tetratricopeptide (TPR) repeat protein/predicted Ser/Thr protein kinase